MTRPRLIMIRCAHCGAELHGKPHTSQIALYENVGFCNEECERQRMREDFGGVAAGRALVMTERDMNRVIAMLGYNPWESQATAVTEEPEPQGDDMPPSPKVTVFVRCGNRFVGEVLDLQDEWEHFKESELPEGMTKPTWQEYIRPLPPTTEAELYNLRGTHFLYGFVECLFQSDGTPGMFLDSSLHGNGDPYLYEVRHDEP